MHGCPKNSYGEIELCLSIGLLRTFMSVDVNNYLSLPALMAGIFQEKLFKRIFLNKVCKYIVITQTKKWAA